MKQLVRAGNCLNCTEQHTEQTPFLVLYSNQAWPFFSHVSKGTTVPKLVSPATVETLELQPVIDQSLALGIFLHPPSFHVACGVWKVVAPPSFLGPLRQSQWTTTLCSDHWTDFFFFLYNSFRTAFTFLKDCYSREQCCLFGIVGLFIPVAFKLC